MTPPIKPPTPVQTTKKPGLKKHLTKPLTGGKTYVAASFGVALQVDTEGNPGHLKIRFYDSDGGLIPDGAILPTSQIPPVAMKAAVEGILTVPANQGETMAQWLLRAATPYVQSLYGAKV